MTLELTEKQKKAGWQVKQLGDVTECFDNLRRPIKGAERIPGPYPYYGASGVVDYVDGYVIDGDYLLLAEDGENLRSRSTPIAFIAKGKSWVNNHAHILRGKTYEDTKYLEYVLSRTDISPYITGSTMPKLNQRVMNRIEIAWPPESERNRIAEILGSIDDKIEANSRLIETLTKLVDARVAEAHAQGSEPVKISDLAVQSKNQLLPAKATDSLVLHYSLPAFDTGAVPAVEEADSIRSSKFVVSRLAVLFSKLNPGTPRIWMVEPDSEQHNFASTEFVVLEPRDGVSLGTLWAACRDPRVSQKLSEFARGTSSSHQRVSPKDILESSVVVPEIVEEETTLIRRLISENVSLAETRDLLIRQLIK